MTAGPEEGSATVLVVAAAAAVIVATAGVLLVIGTVRDVHLARSAADLAALAAAAPTAVGAGVDCRSAESVARANRALLLACGPASDGSAVVAVSVPRSWPRGWAEHLPPQVSAGARAGLVSAQGRTWGDRRTGAMRRADCRGARRGGGRGGQT